jgi:hypothetical protein
LKARAISLKKFQNFVPDFPALKARVISALFEGPILFSRKC